MIVGGSFSNPEAKVPWISFEKDRVMINSTSYRSYWGRLDHCVVVSHRGRVYVMGTHRFGTEAALMYFREDPDVSFALVRWVDLNENARMERGGFPSQEARRLRVAEALSYLREVPELSERSTRNLS
ncbi:MAG: hypothetical protein NZ992_04810 [Candidatus Korarchaeum sp.]|nr:hypothetical protein [Candidatus Korarchaeum sp.]MDW8035928.1 hypothetical protein [Candidatus Korarchaeum sp.]